MDHKPDQKLQAQVEAMKAAFPEAFTGADPDLDLLLEKMEDVLEQISKANKHKSDKPPFAWRGKEIGRRLAKSPFSGTLYRVGDNEVYRPYDHVFIEGESLEVLKMFSQSYAGQIDMIYVDPPSPLKHGFVLLDDPKDALEPYLKLTGAEEGTPETNWPLEAGARHQKWLNFLYPRLMQAHEMLADFGLLFMHSTPEELPFVRFLLDSVFGLQKYLTTILWQKKAEPALAGDSCECILVYCKNTMEHWPKVIPYLASPQEPFSNPDSDPRGAWSPFPVYSETFPVLGGLFGHQRGSDARMSPSGKEVSPPEGNSWLLSKEEMEELTAAVFLFWGEKNDQIPVMKYYKTAGHQFIFPTCLLTPDEAGSLQDAQAELKRDVPDLSDEDLPDDIKPVRLLRKLIQAALPYRESYYTNRVVVDMFGGTGSMAQAVIEQNIEDGYGRRFFSIHLPQALSDQKPDLETFADVARQRVAGARASLEYDWQEKITYFRLGRSNFKHWQEELYPCQWILRKQIPEDELEWEEDESRKSAEGPPTELKEDWEVADVIFELVLRYGGGFRYSFYPVSMNDEASVTGLMSEHGHPMFQFCLMKNIPYEILRELGELYDECLIMPRSSVDEDTYTSIERLYRVKWI